MYTQTSKGLLALLASLAIAACTTAPESNTRTRQAKDAWSDKTLTAALASPSRPQADRDRDADRKPAQLMTFLGVEHGMTTLDVMASGGYVTEVLSVTVGPTGKVYAENPAAFQQPYGKAMSDRLSNNRLPNVTRLDGDQAMPPPGSVDVAVTAMNLHDIYNINKAIAQFFVKAVYDTLQPGGVFGIIDHVGVDGADNATLHRMTKQQAIDLAKAVGFIVEADSNLLAHPGDDHTKLAFDASLRGKTDQFVLKLRKPK